MSATGSIKGPIRRADQPKTTPVGNEAMTVNTTTTLRQPAAEFVVLAQPRYSLGALPRLDLDISFSPAMIKLR
jgi:hypothetical protein